jgi:hypothetical protein
LHVEDRHRYFIVSSPQKPENRPPPSSVSRGALRLIYVILAALLLLSLYANVQRLRRDKIETITFTPAASPPASPSPSPR